MFAYLTGRRFWYGKLRGDPYFWVIATPFLIFMGVLAAAGKYKYWSDKFIQSLNAFFGEINQALGLGATQFLIGVFVCALGIGAYLFKKASQKWYGNVEVVVGVVTALIVAGTFKAGTLELSKCATLAGSAYVIARGLENRSKGKQTKNAAVTIV